MHIFAKKIKIWFNIIETKFYYYFFIMKKNISLLIIFIIVISIYNISFSNRYGGHREAKTIWDWITWCTEDWDYAWWKPTWSKYPLSWTYTYDSRQNGESGNNMWCEFRDWQDPTWTISYYDWWINVTNQTVSYSASDTWWSWISSVVLQVSSSDYTNAPDYTTWWTSWSNVATKSSAWSYTYSYTWNNNTAYKFQLIVTDVSWLSTTYTPVLVTKIDTTPPDPSDVHSVTEANLLADDSQAIELRIERDWGTATEGSPISSVDRCFENYSNTDNWWSSISITSYLDTSTDSYFRRDEDIRNVDNDRHPTAGNREYSYKIINICDEAWNCVSSWNCSWAVAWSKTPSFWNIDYYVYANTVSQSTFNNKDVITDDISNPIPASWNIADGSVKDITIRLEDRYWNEIVPTSDGTVNRTIDFEFYWNNTLNLDQYTRTWNGVFMNRPDDTGHYFNRLWVGSFSESFDNQPSNDWTYNFWFRIYTPTDGNYMSEPVPGWNVEISDIKFDIDDSITSTVFTGAATPQNVDVIALNGADITSWNNIDFDFAPKYEAHFSWEIYDYWFVEWSVQNSSIDITDNSPWTPTVTSISNSHIYMEFGSGANNEESSDLNMTLSWWVMTSVAEWHTWSITLLTPSLNIATQAIQTQAIQTLLIQESWATLESLQHAHLSTHIGYTISNPWLPWWVIDVRYNSDIIWKSNYFGWVSNDNTYQSGLKVLWNTSSKKTHEIMTHQDDQDLHILWNLTKASLRKDLKRKVYMIVKNISPTTNHTIDNLTWDIWNTQYGDNRIYNNKVIYYKWAWDVELWDWTTDLTVEWKKTIIIEWANLYIRSNMFYWDNTKDILWIIVLSDRNWNGWNIYIDPSVTNIVWTLYADKSLISYDWTNELDWNTDQRILNNQLHISGSVFSENTIWGARATPLECPYYITTTCTQEDAQKYDLNYLRRYFIYDDDSSWPWAWTIELDWTDPVANGWSSYIWVIDQYRQYPIVIEYNSLLQSSPPPMFNK